jgi:hypothetical protein
VNSPSRAVTLVSRFALLLALLSLSVFLAVRTVLGSQDTFEQEIPITQVAKKGPATVDDVVWELDSLQIYTRLVNENKEPVEADVPDGAVIVKAVLKLTATDRTRLDDGFSCEAQLRDDRGNVWENESVFGVGLPTFCGDSELKIVRGKPFRIAKIYFIPKEAVPHIVGLITPGTDNASAEDRLLLTP